MASQLPSTVSPLTRKGESDIPPAGQAMTLRKEVEEGRFQADLFYRLSVFTLSLPPLRNRREDIPILVEHLVPRYAQEVKRPVPRLDDAVMAHLQTYSWPGNVSELESLIRQAMVLCRGLR